MPPVEFIQLQFLRITQGEEFGGVFQEAAVGGVAKQSDLQFDADDANSGVNAFYVNGVPDEADFFPSAALRTGRAEGGGVKTVLAGIAVARLAAALSLFHTGIIAHLFLRRKAVMSLFATIPAPYLVRVNSSGNPLPFVPLREPICAA